MKFTLKRNDLSKIGLAFYDQGGNEWQALPLYNRDRAAVVYLPLTCEIDQEPNISVSRHEGRRTIDEGTYQYYLRLYHIRETDAA